MCLEIGTQVKTSYNTGPYIIHKVSGPCICPKYSDERGSTNSGMDKQSPEHFHFTCIDVDNPSGSKSYLNGYAMKENQVISVWTGEHLIIMATPIVTQYSLF